MPRLKLTVAYEGTRYAGWQLQAFRDKKRPPTVQGELERCIARILGKRAPVHGAGRTDSGVHAEAQACHVDIPAGFQRVDWLQAINIQLSPDIRILDAQWVPLDFHARKSAQGKRYAYTLWMGRDKAFPRIQAFVWNTPPLDWTPVPQTIARLVGQHDFASFQNSGSRVKSTVRMLRKVDILPGMAGTMTCPKDWPVTTLVFEGDGFLKQMVRNLVGLLVWVGQGKIDPDAVPDILEAKKRAALPSPSAPARGLTLLDVLY